MRGRDKDFRLEDALAAFRSMEEADDAIVVIHDEPAMKVLVAWMHTDQRWEKPETRAPLPTAGRMGRLWDWIVSGWEVDVRAVAKRAGVPMGVAHAKLTVLIGNRLVYPDGSISKGVRAVLGAYTAKKLGIKRRQPPEPPRAVARNDGEGN